MFRILLLAGLMSLAAHAAEKPTYSVRCPKCEVNQILKAKQVLVTGGYATNVHGISGTMQSSTASFKCPKCRHKFQTPVKPDKFVPSTVATEIPPARPKKR